jgi:hypothetical protein
MWRRIISTTVVVLFAFGPSVSSAKTIYVDDNGKADFRTIQAGINAAHAGDIVLVGPGTYVGQGNRDIDLRGMSLVVRSEHGAETCIIDCQGSATEPHRGFYFHNGEDTSSVVQGFTITGGYIPASSDPRAGGGICCKGASPLITDCIVTKNVATRGGGIACEDSEAVILNCRICDNVASIEPSLWANGFSDNWGGGFWSLGADANPTVMNCVIAGNRASESGGGIWCSLDFSLINCTIYGNRAAGAGSGIRMMSASAHRGIVRNCIIWANEPLGCGQIASEFREPAMVATTIEVTYCTIQGYAISSCLGGVKLNCIEADPLVANPGHWDTNGTPDDLNDDLWVDGDYHLKSQMGRWDPAVKRWVEDDVTSPCIDAGDPDSLLGDEPWPNGERINMGAYGGTAQASMSLEPETGPTHGKWTPPMPLAEINTSTAEEWSPILSGDGLALYFSRVRAPESYEGRIFKATRAEPYGHFSSPMPVWGSINNTGADVHSQWISPDERRMYYTYQDGARFHLMMSERYAKWAPWPVGWDIWKLNFLDDRLHTPRLTPDELTIFFTGPDAGGLEGAYDIWMATRTCHDCLFSEPVPVTKVNTTYNDIHSFISSDGLCLYFASNRNGHYQLFKSARKDARSPFGNPALMPLFDTAGGESMFPCLSPDGREFYFMRQEIGRRSTRDIYVSYQID